MAKKDKRSYTLYILAGLLVAAAFIIGNLYTKIKTLEKGEKGTALSANEDNQNDLEDTQKKEIEISDEDPSMGPKDAKVVLVEFSDFLCPFCAAYAGANKKMVNMMKQRDPSWQPAFPNIKKDYVDTGKVRLVWKDTPFHGPESLAIHAAGRCAYEQGKFWEFHDRVFSLVGEEKKTSKDDLKKIGQALKLNTKKFNECVDSDKYKSKVQDVLSYAQSIGVNGTPATFINGKLVSGAVPYAQFKKMIDEELAK